MRVTGRRRTLRTIAAAAALLLVALAVTLPGVHALVVRALERASAVIQDHPVGGPVLFVALAGLSAMLAFFSSAILVPVGIRAWSPVGCGLLLWVGWLAGGMASYGVARWLGRPLLRRVVADRRVAEYDAMISRRMPFGMVLLVQLALPSEIPGYVLGLARYPPSRYLLALALVELPYAVGVVLMGESFLARRVLPLAALALMATGVAVVAARRLRRQRPPQRYLRKPAAGAG